MAITMKPFTITATLLTLSVIVPTFASCAETGSCTESPTVPFSYTAEPTPSAEPEPERSLREIAGALDALAAAWLNEAVSDETKAAVADARSSYAALADDADDDKISEVIGLLEKATDKAKAERDSCNVRFANGYTVLQGYLGWEGDFDAPCIWVDGTVTMRDRGNACATFGVTNLDRNSVTWEASEGYLPCWTSTYS